MLPSIHQRYNDNLLLGATVVPSVSPMATYDADTLLTHQPGARVRWAVDTVTIRFELAGAAQRADILVIPVWNVDAGASVASLESDAGMNVPITVPAMMPSGIPRTTAIDLTALEPNATLRTSDAFDLVIAGNSENLIIGGAVLLYGPKRTIEDSEWEWGLTKDSRFNTVRHENDYGADYVVNRRTRNRGYKATTQASPEDAETIELWADDNFGEGLPGLMWPRPDQFEAFFGRMEPLQSQQTQQGNAVVIAVTFAELSKGKPVV